jgi:hypothetical protein
VKTCDYRFGIGLYGEDPGLLGPSADLRIRPRAETSRKTVVGDLIGDIEQFSGSGLNCHVFKFALGFPIGAELDQSNADANGLRILSVSIELCGPFNRTRRAGCLGFSRINVVNLTFSGRRKTANPPQPTRTRNLRRPQNTAPIPCAPISKTCDGSGVAAM